MQLDRCGYDPKSSRYGADTSRTEEITQAIVEDIRGPRRKCTNTWEKHRRAVAHDHQLLLAHESSRQAALVTHNDLVMVISTPNSDKIVEDSREKGLICTATLKSNKGLCDKIKCGITTEEHFGPIGLVLCKRHLQMHIDKYKPKPINIVSQIPISVLNDETGDEGLWKCASLLQSGPHKGQPCGVNLKPEYYNSRRCGRHQEKSKKA